MCMPLINLFNTPLGQPKKVYIKYIYKNTNLYITSWLYQLESPLHIG